jgi:hypothetical protein
VAEEPKEVLAPLPSEEKVVEVPKAVEEPAKVAVEPEAEPVKETEVIFEPVKEIEVAVEPEKAVVEPTEAP